MKTCLILLSLLLLSAALEAAPADSIRKQTCVYAIKDADTLRLDKYAMPDIKPGAPCVVFVFGGGFAAGSREGRTNVDYMKRLARAGYTAIAIDYRLGMKALKTQKITTRKQLIGLFENTVSMAVEDLVDATAYVIAQAPAWGIDPARIIACGSSAGAVTVLQAEYAICNGEEVAQRLPEGFNYAGVISFAGAIYSNRGNLRWASAPCPILMFHGEGDHNVPYGRLKAGLRLRFYGSGHIAHQLQKMESPYWLYSVENAAHEISHIPMSRNMAEIGSFIEKMVEGGQKLLIETVVTDPAKPEATKNLSLREMVKANYRPRPQAGADTSR